MSTPLKRSSSTGEVAKFFVDLRKEFSEDSPDFDTIQQLFESCDFSCEENKKFVHFNPHRYTRNLIALDKKFSLLLICWSKGQETPIHDHGNRNIQSWVRVLKGSLKVFYGYKEGVSASQQQELESVTITPESGVYRFDDSYGLHKTVNVAEDKTVSLHLYTPPYVECHFKKEQEELPIECENSYVPVVHCPEPDNYNRGLTVMNMVTEQKSGPVYANFSQLVEILQREIIIEADKRHSPENISHIKSILRLMHFNSKEWRQYAKFTNCRYTRNLIGYDEKFTILLLCWDKGQKSPIHDHAGSNCWVKVLEGNLEESLYDVEPDGETVKLRVANIYSPGGVTYINDNIGVHRMGNPNLDRVAISLHVYSPPYNQCHIFDPERPLKQLVSIVTAYGVEHPFVEKKLGESSCDKLYTNLKSFVQAVKVELSEGPLDTKHMDLLMSTIHFSPQEWKQYIHFNPDQYTRNLLAFNEVFSLMLVCWGAGQKTPIHDHGKSGRIAWVKVLEGALQFEKFTEKEDGTMEPVQEDPLFMAAGQYTMLIDDDLGYHQTSNPSEHNRAVSLHLYTPPYVECSFKTEGDEPKLIPVAYCSKEAGKCSTELAPELQCQFRQTMFSNFSTFADLLARTFDSFESQNDIDPEQIRTVISHIQFNPQEWREFGYACKNNYSRNLVAYAHNFSVYLNCWEPGQISPIHDHSNSPSWVKVLEGQLEDTHYECSCSGLKEISSSSISNDEVRYFPRDIIHKTGNSTGARVYSLHVYSPPYEQCNCYDVDGAKTLYCCDHHVLPFEQ